MDRVVFLGYVYVYDVPVGICPNVKLGICTSQSQILSRV